MRSSGRTTRLADKYIQQLFNNPNETIEIRDHFNDNEAHRYLTDKIYFRVRNEHPHIVEYLYRIDYNKLILRR